MANLNKVFLIGRFVADPELSHTSSGTPYTRFRLAVNNPYKDKNGNWQDDTLFIDVTVWGDYADHIVQKYSKGSKVLVEGRLRQSNWETEEGEKRSKIEVKADRVVGLDYKKQEESSDLDEIDDIEF